VTNGGRGLEAPHKRKDPGSRILEKVAVRAYALAVWTVALIVRHVPKGETGHMPEEKPDPASVAPAVAEERVPDRSATRPSVDDMGEASFPASDPPAVWTWDPPRPAR